MSGWDPGSGASSTAPRRVQGAGRRRGARLGPLPITAVSVVVALAFFGSLAFIAYAVIGVRDSRQIPMLSAGSAVLCVAFVAIALGALINLWRAGARGRTGSAMALAIVGGFCGLSAIGCFTITAILALLWKSA
jgi:uncharacterized membrane protein YedE/YeeE